MAIEWSSLIAHRHYIEVKSGKWSLRVCARCTGVVLGFTSFITLVTLLTITFTLPIELLILSSIALTLPAITDWLTQSWGLRESTNALRLLTGMGEGAGVALLSFLPLPFLDKMVLLLLLMGFVVFLGQLRLGSRSCQVKVR